MRLRGTLIDRIMTSLSKKVPEGFLTARYYPCVCFRVRWVVEFKLWGAKKLVRFLTKTERAFYKIDKNCSDLL